MKNSPRRFTVMVAGVIVACVVIATAQDLKITRSTIDGIVIIARTPPAARWPPVLQRSLLGDTCGSKRTVIRCVRATGFP